MALESIDYKNRKLRILDQLLLPHKSIYVPIHGVQDAFNAIKNMQVRGAPAIAVVAALCLIPELDSLPQEIKKDGKAVLNKITESLAYIQTARQTAVNLTDTCQKLLSSLESSQINPTSGEDLIEYYIDEAQKIFLKDYDDNLSIAALGSSFIQQIVPNKSLKILTHCNTGSLATSGYGTALGIIRHLHKSKNIDMVYFTETRPYNQGSRLTSYELLYEKIPSTLICDSMVSALIQQKKIDLILVGADRVTRNGDTANKIGTFQLAVIAQYHGIPFLVAAPTTSIDPTLPSGDSITIEERAKDELTHVHGLHSDSNDLIKVLVPPANVDVWNPAFDITPAHLITAIITESRVYENKDGFHFE